MLLLSLMEYPLQCCTTHLKITFKPFQMILFFKHLQSSFTIRDQARLCALSLTPGTSGGQQKHCHNLLCIGLSISPCDFTVALRLWLGIPLLPSSPLCTCLSVIDLFGDHLLVASMVPCGTITTMLQCLLCTKPCSRITLVFFWEQGLLSDQPHPGDIYHPDFLLGQPACQKCHPVYHYIFCFFSGWDGCWCW